MDARQLAIAGFAALAVVSPAAAQSSALEGQWANPKHNMIVEVGRCGGDYCAVVVKASAKAQANARKGGTTHFIGTQILRVHPASAGTFKGTAFDPETNMHVAATVRVVGSGIMDLKGCAFFGLVCEQQRWTKIS